MPRTTDAPGGGVRIEKGHMVLELEEDRADGAPVIGVFLEDWGRDEGPEFCSLFLTADEAATLAGELALLVDRIRKGKG